MNQNANKSIEQYLLEYINKHKFDFSQALPSENFLATKFKVSRQTARIGLNKLLNKGFLVSVKGSGYFVNPNIDYIKLNSIGQPTSHVCNKMYDIDINLLDSILNTNVIKANINKNDYYAYRKIYENDETSNVLYTNSFILKKAFVNIDKDKIKESLLNFIGETNILLDTQFNNIRMTETNGIDQQILNQTSELTPTIFGIVVDKQKNIIEIFERRYSLDAFNITFAKIF